MRAGSIASATPTATTGSTRSSCCASSTAAASTARTRSILAPDGKSLYIVAGNATRLARGRRLAGAADLGRGQPAPAHGRRRRLHDQRKGPWRPHLPVSPDGKHWELVSIGYRNPFDIAFNRAGELFTYDSDMEWDVNMPWYRPTRVLHVVSGGDFGYRNGSGKWPPYYIDSLPPVVNVGPGSPTGVTFGYGAKFPAKYQDALYLCDWSYGKLYALHLAPKGATYDGELEEFVAGTPLALTDVVVNPKDGAMYFAVGGRNTQSGLYRVTYAGGEPTSPATATDLAAAADGPRLAAHARGLPRPQGSEGCRRLRGPTWATPTASFAGPPGWRSSARNRRRGARRPSPRPSSPEAALNALLALTHVSAPRPGAPRRTSPCSGPGPPRPASWRPSIGSPGIALDIAQQLDLLRVYEVVLNRFGRPDESTARRLIARFDPHYPSRVRELNAELCQLARLSASPGRRRQDRRTPGARRRPRKSRSHYAQALRTLKSGWTPALRQAYFSWIAKSGQYQGGQQPPWFHGQHQARCDRQPERLRQGRAQADPGGASP